MAYQSEHTGIAIDAGISINDTQNNRLTALENKDTSFTSQINNLSSTINSLTTIVDGLLEVVADNTEGLETLQNEFNNLKPMLQIVLRIITSNTAATMSCSGGTLSSSSSGVWEFIVPKYGDYTIAYTADGATTNYIFEAKYFGINEYKLNYTYIMTVDDFVDFYNGSHSILGSAYDGYPGFTLVGTNTANNNTGMIRLDYRYDLTYVKTLEFYAVKNANHGNVKVWITDGVLNSGMVTYAEINYVYGNLNTSWNKYTIDVSKITGEKTISFIGGYSDSTGSSSSSTSYGKISFIYE